MKSTECRWLGPVQFTLNPVPWDVFPTSFLLQGKVKFGLPGGLLGIVLSVVHPNLFFCIILHVLLLAWNDSTFFIFLKMPPRNEWPGCFTFRSKPLLNYPPVTGSVAANVSRYFQQQLQTDLKKIHVSSWRSPHSGWMQIKTVLPLKNITGKPFTVSPRISWHLSFTWTTWTKL